MKKHRQYMEICATHWFILLAFQSIGVFSQDTLDFMEDLAYRTRVQSPLLNLKLCRRISVSIQ
jgi:hypothetical protein